MLSNLTHISWDNVMERELYFTSFPDLAALPDAYSFPSRHFAALLVADTTRMDTQSLGGFSRRLLQSGCSYFCSWGPGCERAHDIFDEHCMSTRGAIMTTWHADEPLDDAIWYFLRTTFPDDSYFDTTRSAIAIVVGYPRWADHVERRMRDISSLADDVLQKI